MRFIYRIAPILILLGCNNLSNKTSNNLVLNDSVSPIPSDTPWSLIERYARDSTFYFDGSQCPEIDPDGDYYVSAKPPFDESNMRIFISNNFHWPKDCLSKDSVAIIFEVDKLGKVHSPTCLCDLSTCQELSDSISSFIKRMPNWIPAYSIDTNCCRIENVSYECLIRIK